MSDACERTARYYDNELGDGELAAADEQAALDHLAGCARCQAELGDLVGFDVMLKDAVAAPAIAPRSRWRLIVPIGAALAAAAALVFYLRLDRSPPPVALALADQRAVEARFTAPAFGVHRHHAVSRAAGGREEFTLAALAGLEQRGDHAALAAAQASSGELERARAALAKVAPGPARDADLAAVELLARRPDQALAAADLALAAAPELTVARWNRAIALRELGLSLSAADELERVAATAEPGWSDEAKARATALRAPMIDRKASLERFTAAGQAMIDRTGAPLALDEVRRRPGLARIYFHEALRGAATRDEAMALAPIAAELDRLAGTDGAGRALARTAGGDFAVRGPLALAYREVALTRATPEASAALLARVTRAGAAVDDLRLGVVTLTAKQRLDEMAALARASGDPWFELYVVRERARQLLAAGQADRAEALLREAIAGCDQRAWAQRCGGLAIDLATHYSKVARFPEAEEFAMIAVQSFAASGATQLEDHALTRVAEIQRSRDRGPLARATFAEIRARAADQDCGTARFAQSGVFITDVYRDPRKVSTPPPEPHACGLAPELIEVGAMVDRARMTRAAADVDAARAWIAAARAHPALALSADVAEARLLAEQGPDAAARLRALTARATDPELRAWIFTTRVDEAGHRRAWSEVIAIAAEETGAAAPATCVLAASVDDNRLTAAAIGPAGPAVGAHGEVPTPLAWDGAALVPPAIRDALRGCPGVAVIARPPVHGRADLLPPAMAWWFTGGRGEPPPPPSRPPHEVIVGDAVPPAALGLPALAPLAPPAGAVVLRGPDARRDRVLAELAGATYAELHVHGRVDLAIADESFLALTPGADGRWALTAADLRQARLVQAPVIVLAACRAAEVAPYLSKRWSLPDAFLAAGARAVIAPTVDIPDDEAARFFDQLRARIGAGEDPATALAALRADALARDPASWTARVIVFR